MTPLLTKSISAATTSLPLVNEKYVVSTIAELFYHMHRSNLIDHQGTVCARLAEIVPPKLPNKSVTRLSNIIHQPIALTSHPANEFHSSPDHFSIPPNTIFAHTSPNYLVSPFKHVDYHLVGSSVIKVLGVEYMERIFQDLNIIFSENMKDQITSNIKVNDYDIRIDCRGDLDLYDKCHDAVSSQLLDLLDLPQSDKMVQSLKTIAYLKSGYVTNHLFILALGTPQQKRLELSFFNKILDRPSMFGRDSASICLHTDKVVSPNILQTILDYLFKIIRAEDPTSFNNLMWSRMLSLNYQNHVNINRNLQNQLLEGVLQRKPRHDNLANYLVALLKHTAKNHLPYLPNGTFHLAFQGSYLLCKKISPLEIKKFWKRVLDDTFISNDPLLNVANGFVYGSIDPLAFYHYLHLCQHSLVKNIEIDLTDEDLLRYCIDPAFLTNAYTYFPIEGVYLYDLLFLQIKESSNWMLLWSYFEAHLTNAGFDTSPYKDLLPFRTFETHFTASSNPQAEEICLAAASAVDLAPHQSIADYSEPAFEELSYQLNLSLNLTAITTLECSLVREEISKLNFKQNLQSNFDDLASQCDKLQDIIEALNFGALISEELSSHDVYADLFLRGIAKFNDQIPKVNYRISFLKIGNPEKSLELLDKFNKLKFPYEKFDFSPILINLIKSENIELLVADQIDYCDQFTVSPESLILWLRKVTALKQPFILNAWLGIVTKSPFLSFLCEPSASRAFFNEACSVIEGSSLPYLENIKEKLQLDTQLDNIQLFFAHLRLGAELNILIKQATCLNHMKCWNSLFEKRGDNILFRVNLDELTHELRVEFLRRAFKIQWPGGEDDVQHLQSIITIKNTITPLTADLYFDYIYWLTNYASPDCLIEAVKSTLLFKDSLKKDSKALSLLAFSLIPINSEKETLQPFVQSFLELPLLFKDRFPLVVAYSSPQDILELVQQSISPDRTMINYLEDFILNSTFYKNFGDEAYSKLFTKWVLASLKAHTKGALTEKELINILDYVSSSLHLLDLTNGCTKNNYFPETEVICFDYILFLLPHFFEKKCNLHLLMGLLPHLSKSVYYNTRRIVLHQTEGFIPLLPHKRDDNPAAVCLSILDVINDTDQPHFTLRSDVYNCKLISKLLKIPNLDSNQYIFISGLVNELLTSMIGHKNSPPEMKQVLTDYFNFKNYAIDSRTIVFHIHNTCKLSKALDLNESDLKKHNLDLKRFRVLYETTIDDLQQDLYKKINNAGCLKSLKGCTEAFYILRDNNLALLNMPGTYYGFWSAFLTASFKFNLCEKIEGRSLFSQVLDIFNDLYTIRPGYLDSPNYRCILTKFILTSLNERKLEFDDQIKLLEFFNACHKKNMFFGTSEGATVVKIFEERAPLLRKHPSLKNL